MENTAIALSDFQSILTTVTGQISVQSVVTVLVAGVGAGVGFAFMWWGARKLIRVLMSAFKKGRVSI